MTEVTVGISAVREFTVTDDDTAVALGSGDVPNLATLRVVARLEAATVACLADVPTTARRASAPGSTSTTRRVAGGAHVTAAASVVEIDGRRVAVRGRRRRAPPRRRSARAAVPTGASYLPWSTASVLPSRLP